MNKLVYNVFKAIALSIIFIFVFDIAFYMYRVTSLNARMESITTSLKKVVMENNYLPSEVAETYSTILKRMVCDFNRIPYGSANLNGGGNLVNGTNGNSINSAAFISGMHWNYYSDANVAGSINAVRQRWNGSSWVSQTVNVLKKRMNTPAEYGDIMVVQLRVGVFQPIWGWTQANGRYDYNGESANSWVRNAASTELSYTYYVPCLNFRTVTGT